MGGACTHQDSEQMPVPRVAIPPGGLQGSVLVLYSALRPNMLPREAPTALVVCTALHAPVQQDAAGQVCFKGDPLVAALPLLDLDLR